jgi:hypothetical protein
MIREEDGSRALLREVLDEIIPPNDDRSFPGAGELGVAERIEEALADRPDVAHIIERGLASISDLAGRQSPSGFGGLSRSERVAVLREVEAAEPGLFGVLVMQAYFGYYTDRRITDRLGVRNPPQPEGYDLEPGDLRLLDPVRARPKLWRDAPAREEREG